MSVNGINPANGVDLLARLKQASGFGSASNSVDAGVGVLKKAVAITQLSEQELLASASSDTTGKLLSIFAWASAPLRPILSPRFFRVMQAPGLSPASPVFAVPLAH